MDLIEPLWKYDPEDKTTWKYKTCDFVYNDEAELISVNWVKNPKFSFDAWEKLRKKTF